MLNKTSFTQDAQIHVHLYHATSHYPSVHNPVMSFLSGGESNPVPSLISNRYLNVYPSLPPSLPPPTFSQETLQSLSGENHSNASSRWVRKPGGWQLCGGCCCSCSWLDLSGESEKHEAKRWYFRAATPPSLLLLDCRTFGRWHEVGGQRQRQLVALQLHLDEVVGEGKLVIVQEPVLIHVGQFPDLS